MFFLVASLILTIACSTITIRTLVAYTEMKFIYKLAISILIILGWLSPVIVGFCRKHFVLQGLLYDVLTYGGYFLFGWAFITFMLLFARDFLWYASYGISKLFHADWSWLNPQNSQSLKYANIITAILSFSVAFFAVYQANKVPDVKEIDLTSTKLKKEVRIVQLSDVHITRSSSENRIRRLIDKVNALTPDVIVLTGDIIDDKASAVKNYFPILDKLQAKDGVYFVIGNHEYYNGLGQILKALHQTKIKHLMNEGVKIADKNLYIGGVPDKSAAMMNPYFAIKIEQAAKGGDKQNYRVLLSHNPSVADKVNKEYFDLVLSGHTHGGQIFPFNFLAQKANKYLAGLYNVNDTKLYVSRGVGYWGPPMRLGAPAEITLIKITPQKK